MKTPTMREIVKVHTNVTPKCRMHANGGYMGHRKHSDRPECKECAEARVRQKYVIEWMAERGLDKV